MLGQSRGKATAAGCPPDFSTVFGQQRRQHKFLNAAALEADASRTFGYVCRFNLNRFALDVVAVFFAAAPTLFATAVGRIQELGFHFVMHAAGPAWLEFRALGQHLQTLDLIRQQLHLLTQLDVLFCQVDDLGRQVDDLQIIFPPALGASSIQRTPRLRSISLSTQPDHSHPNQVHNSALLKTTMKSRFRLGIDLETHCFNYNYGLP